MDLRNKKSTKVIKIIFLIIIVIILIELIIASALFITEKKNQKKTTINKNITNDETIELIAEIEEETILKKNIPKPPKIKIPEEPKVADTNPRTRPLPQISL